MKCRMRDEPEETTRARNGVRSFVVGDVVTTEHGRIGKVIHIEPTMLLATDLITVEYNDWRDIGDRQAITIREKIARDVWLISEGSALS